MPVARSQSCQQRPIPSDSRSAASVHRQSHYTKRILYSAQDSGFPGTLTLGTRSERLTRNTRSSSSSAHPRKIPAPLVLPSSSANFQLDHLRTSSSHPHTPVSPNEQAMDIIGHRELPFRSGQHARRSNSLHHVRMGNQYKCPRTPLRSAGSSAGFTPTLTGFRNSLSESGPSTHSPVSAERLSIDLNHSPNVTNSVLALTFSKQSIHHRQTYQPSGPIRAPESDTCSSYSHDSDTSVGGFASELKPQSASRSPRISSSSFAHLDGALNTRHAYDYEIPFSAPARTELPPTDDHDQRLFPSLPHTAFEISVDRKPSQDHSGPPRSASTAKLIKKKPSRSTSILTPSPIKETGKTIQVRRSFGQLLLFSRTSQTDSYESSYVGSNPERCQSTVRDEEKEELQIETGSHDCVGGSMTSYNDSELSSHRLNRAFRSIDDWEDRSHSRQDRLGSKIRSAWGSANDLRSLGTEHLYQRPAHRVSLQECRKELALKSDDYSRSVRPSTANATSTKAGRSNGSRKLVKSHSTLRETIFKTAVGGKNQTARHTPGNISGGVSKNNVRSGPSAKLLPKRRGTFSFHTLVGSIDSGSQPAELVPVEKKRNKDLKIEDVAESMGDTDRAKSSKRPGSNPSSPFKILKFWKKKKTTGSANIDSRSFKSGGNEHHGKDGLRETKAPYFTVDKISAPIPIQSKEPRVMKSKLKNAPSLVSLKLNDNNPSFSSLKEYIKVDVNDTPQSVKRLVSPNALKTSLSTSPLGKAEKAPPNNVVNFNHFKPIRPPRRRPVVIPNP